MWTILKKEVRSFLSALIAYMVMLAFAIACSANFPVLLMSVMWKDCTTKGAVIGGFVGLLASAGLTILSPAV